jgi:hypothetical protein
MRATVAAVALGVLLLASSDTAANARGSAYGAGSPQFAPTYRSRPFYHTFRGRPLYGGFIGVPFYGPDTFFDYPPYAPYAPDTSSGNPAVPAASSINRCLQPTHKTVTVPAEAGGTKEVTVTYCHH